MSCCENSTCYIFRSQIELCSRLLTNPFLANAPSLTPGEAAVVASCDILGLRSPLRGGPKGLAPSALHFSAAL
jgi:hypothetical protein